LDTLDPRLVEGEVDAAVHGHGAGGTTGDLRIDSEVSGDEERAVTPVRGNRTWLLRRLRWEDRFP
jgi:hypothetical protein